MAMLVILLPVAFAQQLKIEKYSGRDNADGYVRSSNDMLTVVVFAEMQGNPSAEVAKTRIRLCRADGACNYFNTCTLEGVRYKCTYTTTDLPSFAGETYSVKLYDVNDYEIASKDITVRVDRIAPSIVLFEVEPKTSRDGRTRINYRAEDYSTAAGDISYCSGLKEVRITANNQTIQAETPGVGVCGDEERFDYTHQTTSNYESVDFCIKATDYIGMSSAQKCEKFSIDNSPPRIAQLKLRDPQGYEFSHMRSGQTITADIYITIEGENDIDTSTVRADLSKLNPALGEKNPDDKKGNDYIWRSITVTNPENCEVRAKARDMMGNEASATLTCTLPLDNTGPEPTLIYTNAAELNGTAMLSASGTIYAELTETGSGMERGEAYLDLHKIGLGTGVKADRCEEKSPGQWLCTWENVKPTIDSAIQTIRLTQQTKDDLGNIATKYLEIPVIIDKTPPVITNVLATFIHQTADYGPRAVNGDSIEFLFNISGAAEAYADLTEVGGNENTPATECTPESCKFDVLIDASGPQNVSIYFEFLDLAKNKAVYNYKFFIYGLRNDTNADYWKSTVTCSPAMIDRNTATFHEHPVYCHVKLTPKNKQADAVYTEVGELTDCTGNFTYVTEIEAVNNEFGSKSPHLVFTLAATEYAVNELKFSCPVFVTTRIGNYFMPYAEREDVNVTLKFYNLPYGELYSNNEKKIKNAMKANYEWAKWIGQVEGYLDQARSLCNIKSDFTTIINALDAVLNLFGIAISLVFGACVFTGEGCSAADELEEARSLLCKDKGILHTALEGLGEGIKTDSGDFSAKAAFNFLDLMCKYANCQLTAEEAAGFLGAKEGEYKSLVKSSDIVGGWDWVCKGKWQTGGLSLNLQDYELGQAKTPTDTKESLVMSTVCLCIPGVLYNLNKMRQIRCQYAYCLGKRVLQEGLPQSYCHDEKNYLTCNYVTGQIFELIPFAWLHNQISNMVQEFYANPISALAAIAGCLCGGCSQITQFDYCGPQQKTATGTMALAYVGCQLAKTAAKIGDAIASIKQMQGKDYWNAKASNNWCDQAEEMLK
ncbi:MAG: hypothetical protein QW666_03585 [Candidatus Woesearchaeota archaeon]